MAPAFPAKRRSPARSSPQTFREATDRLRDAIVSGRFTPNERLVEEQLASEFGTKRPAIRAALALLEQERLVVHERNRGARVRAITAAEAAEILEARATLEGLVARKAAENVDAAGIAKLNAIVAEMEKHERAGNLRGYSQCNGRFHQAISDIARHETSVHLLALLKSQSVRHQYRSVLNPGRPTKSLREHKAILRAIARHDARAAEDAMRAHIEQVRKAVQESDSALLP
jgi:DNA-binding GntR family transcriptional regulator